MSWSVPPTVLTGTVMSSSIWNSVVQNNISLTAPGLATTAGDIFYVTGLNSIARLGIGTKYQILRVNSGVTSYEWSSTPPCALVYKHTGIITINAGDNVIVYDTALFDTDSMFSGGSPNLLTCNTPGLYYVAAHLTWQEYNAVFSATHVTVRIDRYNSSNVFIDSYVLNSNDEHTALAGSQNAALSTSTLVFLNSGDYITQVANLQAGAPSIVTINDGHISNVNLMAIRVAG